MKNNRRNKTFLASATIALSLLTTGCTNSGVAPLPNGVYFLSAGDMWAFGGTPSSKVIAEVYRDANKFCNDKGLKFQELKHAYTPTSYGQSPTYSVEFRCITKD